jgi:hypothetical protein
MNAPSGMYIRGSVIAVEKKYVQLRVAKIQVVRTINPTIEYRLRSIVQSLMISFSAVESHHKN